MYSVVFTYKVDGHYCGGTFETMTAYREGDPVLVSYDPQDPDRNNYTVRGDILRWVYIVFFALLAVLAVYLFLQPKLK